MDMWSDQPSPTGTFPMSSKILSRLQDKGQTLVFIYIFFFFWYSFYKNNALRVCAVAEFSPNNMWSLNQRVKNVLCWAHWRVPPAPCPPPFTASHPLPKHRQSPTAGPDCRFWGHFSLQGPPLFHVAAKRNNTCRYFAPFILRTTRTESQIHPASPQSTCTQQSIQKHCASFLNTK